jgi:DNA polymerase-3 subunit epsilon/CBS domain-containing protein
LLGGLRTEAGRIDLKLAALLPIVSAARVLAMRHGVEARSTQARLEGLAQLKRGGDADLAAIMGAHRTVLAAILRQQVRDIHAGVPAGSRVEVARLTRRQRDDLKRALGVVPSLEDLVRNLLF